MRGPALTVGGLALATAALRLRDPHVSGSWGACPLFELTGIYCPGCGGLRAVNDLTHGDLASAAQSNALFIAFLPVLALILVSWTVRRWRGDAVGQPWWLSTSAAVVLAVASFGFMLVRNLPGMDWLQPV